MGKSKALAVVVLVTVMVLSGWPVMAQAAEDPSPPDWVGILEKVIMLVVKLAVPPLLVWALSEFKRWREQQLDHDLYWRLDAIVRSAVAAAEQLGLTEQIEDVGEVKLACAIDYVERALEAWGIPIDVDPCVDVILGMIEAEVNRQFPPAAETAA